MVSAVLFADRRRPGCLRARARGARVAVAVAACSAVRACVAAVVGRHRDAGRRSRAATRLPLLPACSHQRHQGQQEARQGRRGGISSGSNSGCSCSSSGGCHNNKPRSSAGAAVAAAEAGSGTRGLRGEQQGTGAAEGAAQFVCFCTVTHAPGRRCCCRPAAATPGGGGAPVCVLCCAAWAAGAGAASTSGRPAPRCQILLCERRRGRERFV